MLSSTEKEKGDVQVRRPWLGQQRSNVPRERRNKRHDPLGKKKKHELGARKAIVTGKKLERQRQRGDGGREA